MNMSRSFADCRDSVRAVAEVFQDTVLSKVANDRVGLLSDEQEKKVTKGEAIDRRAVRLMAISGKGGFVSDPALRAKFAESQNVSLADHLVSVGRGAAFFSVLWLTYARADQGLSAPSSKDLDATAALAFALGFMHDANKIPAPGMTAFPDLASVTPDRFMALLKVYGVDAFLAHYGWQGLQAESGAELFRALVMASEVGQSPIHLHSAAAAWVAAGAPAGVSPALVEKVASRCVRWADRLDGAWVKKGAEGVLDELKVLSTHGDALDRQTLGAWAPIEIRDPHHPFILDALLVALEEVCEDMILRQGMDAPPLVAVHHDGVLMALVPAPFRERIMHAAIDRLERDLPFGMTLNMNARKGFSLEGKLPTQDELEAYWRDLEEGQIRQAQSFLELHETALTSELWSDWTRVWKNPAIVERFGVTSLVAPPIKAPLGKYIPFVSMMNLGEACRAFSLVNQDPDQASFVDQARANLWQDVLSPTLALVCVLLMLPKLPKHKDASRVPPTQDERYNAILAHLASYNVHLPASVSKANSDAFSRAVLVAFGAVTALIELSLSEPDQAMSAFDGLWRMSQGFLEGTETKAGLTSVLSPPWQNRAVAELKDRLLARMENRAVIIEAEADGHRCLFLDEPLPANADSIGLEFGLYGVKMSAFSGRSGRPDNIMTAPSKGANFISMMSRCEHALRGEAFKDLRSKSGGIPILASSPLRVGLFASVRHQAGMDVKRLMPKDISSYDLLRAQVKENQINLTAQQLLVESALPLGGYRMSRYEDFPSRLEDQVSFLCRWADAAYRFGRPVHLFRGLPTPSKAFFAFDAMPAPLRKFLGGNAWRLEELPGVILRLKLAEWIFDKKSNGPGGRWFLRLLNHHESWLVAAFLQSLPGEDDRPAVPANLNFILKEIFMSNAQGSTAMAELARLSAQFQMTSGSFYRLSNGDKARSFEIAYDAWKTYQAKRLNGVVALEDFIAGELQQILGRKNTLLGGKDAAEALTKFATRFAAMATPQLMSPDLRRAITGAYVYCFGIAMADRFEAIRTAKASSDSASF